MRGARATPRRCTKPRSTGTSRSSGCSSITGRIRTRCAMEATPPRTTRGKQATRRSRNSCGLADRRRKGRSRSPRPIGSSDVLEHLADSADAFDDRLARRGVRETEVALPGFAERAPRGHRDVRLPEDPFRERRAVSTDVDPREHIERAARAIRRDTVDSLELSEDDVPPRPEFVDHRLQRTGRPSESRDPGLLRECGRARDRVLLDFHDLPVQGRRGDEPAEPPAGHRVGLREAVHGNSAIEHALQGCGRDVLALVQDLLVDLVAHTREVVVRREVREAAHFGPRIHRASGIRRRVEDDQPGPRGDRLCDRLRRRDESVLVCRADRHGLCTRESHHRGVGHPAGIRDERFVPGVEEGHERHEERVLRRRDDHVLGLRGNPILPLRLLRNRLAQLADSGGGRVLRVAVVERLLRRFDDVCGRREIRLADGQGENLLPLALGLCDEVADADRGGGLDREDALRDTGDGSREHGSIEKRTDYAQLGICAALEYWPNGDYAQLGTRGLHSRLIDASISYAKLSMTEPSHAVVTTWSTLCEQRNSRRSESRSIGTKSTDCPRYRTPSRVANPGYRYRFSPPLSV